MQTYHIHINGIVQGVGFRPLVYQLAAEMKLNGHVKNGSDGVHVFFNASEQEADLFFKNIIREAPLQSKIILSAINKVADKNFIGFSILVEDNDSCERRVLLSPDVALCATCKIELHDTNNRRYRYPFITCTQCGPRYSIVNSLPYERHGTSMQKFTQCKTCNEEYNAVTDRRFFSQTNSCEDCGIKLSLHKDDSFVLTSNTKDVLSNIKNFLQHGKIIAVKGIGGFLLLCDANNEDSIQLLRSRKNRPLKPFAVLYPGIDETKNDFEVNKIENDLLQSAEAPIVLLYPKQKVLNNLSVKNIAPGLERLGVMLPYSPLLSLIATDFGKALVATSANISGSPIIYKDEDALAYLFEIADYVISYNRDIIIPQDDSVVQVSEYSHQQIILRRSRGYAPSFLEYKPQKNNTILSTGAFLKSSFTLSVNGNVFVSQFLGSSESYESQQMYKDTLQHWLKLYEVKPEIIITDLHPNYFSHQYAIELAEKYKAEIKFIQHHEAHFAAVLAENNLLNTTEPVLGVIWDGTGLGDDGNIWGGEFFKYENSEMLRCYHFDYFPAIAGDKMALEPRIAALCATNDNWPQSDRLKEKFSDIEWNIYQSLIQTTTLFSSSAGRLFDAVASLLGVCDIQTYEGEAAMYLQALAEDYVDENGFTMDDSYFNEGSHYYRIPTATLMQGIIMDIRKGKQRNYIAAKFHYSLVCLIDIVAKNIGVENICFSGGVFQNALLIDWIKKEYSSKYKLFFHQNLSSNDENISFGQMVFVDNEIKSISREDLKGKGIEENLQTEETFANLKSQIINQ
ncbi:MAG: carbamoyltransferase HypF [Ferruginibacter sp.]